MPPEDEDRIPRSDFERPERRFERERAARLEAEAIAEKGLVSNALKFSPARGEVRLSAAAERAGSALQRRGRRARGAVRRAAPHVRALRADGYAPAVRASASRAAPARCA